MLQNCKDGGGNKNGGQIEAALEVFSLNLNALVPSLILLHEFQIKFKCWLNLLSEDNCFLKGLNPQNG